MNHIDIGKLGAINASEIALGCMRISGMDRNSAETLISAAIDSGINFFDHADICGGGKSEEVFACAFHGSRDICPGFWLETPKNLTLPLFSRAVNASATSSGSIKASGL